MLSKEQIYVTENESTSDRSIKLTQIVLWWNSVVDIVHCDDISLLKHCVDIFGCLYWPKEHGV